MAFTEDEIRHLRLASNDFKYFTNHIFAAGFNQFIGGPFVDEMCDFLQNHTRTIRVSARNHFKSFSFYAYFMWKLMFDGADDDVEAHYFSFNNDMAGYHVSKIKIAITSNPYFRELKDCKKTAESVLRYTWDGKHFTTLTPHGLIQFKRGMHAPLTFIDDPFQDPENELNPSVIFKINEIFKSNILDIPRNMKDVLHVAGTPQTNDDFFFDPDLTRRFAVKVLPAITSEGKALWPEWMNLAELEEKRIERTDRVFKKEYLCAPVYSSKGFFEKEKLLTSIVKPGLKLLDYRTKYITKNDVIAGLDVGQKAHPAHVSVFEKVDGKLIMLYHRFMDNWPYSTGQIFTESNPSQIEFMRLLIENFGIDKLYYDATRGEYNALAEQDLLPSQMEPVIFSLKSKSAMASSFERLVENKRMEIVDDFRLIDQICSVTTDLQAIKSKQGHGDAFWTICLSLYGAEDILSMDENVIRGQEKVKTGAKSIFDDGSVIPVGW